MRVLWGFRAFRVEDFEFVVWCGALNLDGG